MAEEEGGEEEEDGTGSTEAGTMTTGTMGIIMVGTMGITVGGGTTDTTAAGTETRGREGRRTGQGSAFLLLDKKCHHIRKCKSDCV
jgi:hypothetical protein